MGLLKTFNKFKNSSIVILTDFAVRSTLAKLYSQVINQGMFSGFKEWKYGLQWEWLHWKLYNKRFFTLCSNAEEKVLPVKENVCSNTVIPVLAFFCNGFNLLDGSIQPEEYKWQN